MSAKKKVDETTTQTVSVNEVLSNYDQTIVAGIRACVALNESALLIGETGTGKTTLINELAKEEEKVLHRVSVNGSMSVDEILGKWLAKDGSTYWIDGILTSAVRNGHWVVFDELNAMLPEMGFALHSLLDDAKTITLAEKDGEVIKAHPDFRFFGSMNPSDDYAGTKEVNLALQSRFGGVFHIDVFPVEQEIKVLERHKISNDHALKLVNLAYRMRELRKKGDMSTFVSTRDIIQAGKLATAGLAFEQAVVFSVFNKLTAEEREDLTKKSEFKTFKAEVPKSEEVIALEKQLKSEKEAHATYEKAWKESKEAHAKAIAELAEIKKNPLAGVTGLDPKTQQLLKTLGVLKTS